MGRPAPAVSRTAVHALRVVAVDALTDDSIAITLAVPPRLRDVFAFAPGQHLTFVHDHDGEQIRRSYSLCSPPGGPLRVAVKVLPDGAFSTWAHAELQAGDELSVMAPSGRFTLTPERQRTAHYALIAAGSGITPVLSILAAVLAGEPASRCTLVYGNRSASSIMFLDELADLKDRFGERLHLLHVLSRESQGTELAEGRIDGPKFARILETLLPPGDVDDWFLCGPLGMVEMARAALREREVPASAIHRELFYAEETAPPVRRSAPDSPVSSGGAGDAAPGAGAAVTLILDGRRTELTVAPDGPAILEAALHARPDAPYSCKGGVCGTCRCRVTEGEVRMSHHYALEDDELEAGVALACQSHPVSDRVVLDFDAV